MSHEVYRRIDVSYDVMNDDTLLLRISDNGTGFRTSEALDAPSGLGLLMIRERTEGIGGRMDIISDRGQGTVILLVVPLESQPVSIDRNHTKQKGSATEATQTENTSPWGLFD